MKFVYLLVLCSILALTEASCPDSCECSSTTVICSDRHFSSIQIDKIPTTTTTLDYSGNVLSHIKTSDFAGLINLNVLHLHDNNIESIEESSFADLGNLTVFTLYDNKLSDVSKDTFKGLSKLTFLHFQNVNEEKNNLCMSDGVFRPLQSLEVLKMDDNSLGYISDQFFDGLANLKTLYLSLDDVIIIDADAFSNLNATIQFGDDDIAICCCESANGLAKVSSYHGNCKSTQCDDDQVVCKREYVSTCKYKNETLTTTTKAPAVTTKAQTVTTKAPLVTTEDTLVTTKIPVLTTKGQITTTKASIATTKVQVMTTKATIVTTKSPVVTTEAQTTTNKAPNTTVEAKTTTSTESPTTITTKAPAINTRAPTTTSEATITTTEASTTTDSGSNSVKFSNALKIFLTVICMSIFYLFFN